MTEVEELTALKAEHEAVCKERDRYKGILDHIHGLLGGVNLNTYLEREVAITLFTRYRPVFSDSDCREIANAIEQAQDEDDWGVYVENLLIKRCWMDGVGYDHKTQEHYPCTVLGYAATFEKTGHVLHQEQDSHPMAFWLLHREADQAKLASKMLSLDD